MVGALCFVFVTAHVVARHHADYRPFWGALTAFSLLGCVFACACPETLPAEPAEERRGPRTRRARLCGCARLCASCHSLPGRAEAGPGLTACGAVVANPVTRFLLLLSVGWVRLPGLGFWRHGVSSTGL